LRQQNVCGKQLINHTSLVQFD